MTLYSIVVVEDDVKVRAHLVSMINACVSLDLKEDVGTCVAARRALKEHKPDVLLVDLGLPDGSGIDIIRVIDQLRLDTEALVVTGFNDEHHVFQALQAGAKGYISKHDSSQKITDAIGQMMSGGAPISPVIARLMLTRFQPAEAKQQSKELELLTERELSILSYVSRGFTAKEIAEMLEVSYYTVTTHVKNIYRKLKVNSRAEALFEAIQLGLITPG